MHRSPLAWSSAALALLAGCGAPDPDLTAAAACFQAFQAQLRSGDPAACAALVTADSRPALAELPWARLQREPGLLIRGAERTPTGFLVHTGADDAASQPFVVVREHGRFVVDLIATAALYTEVASAPQPRGDTFVPRPLDARDEAAIRRFQLAQPPR